MNFKLSLVIPVFKVEDYVGRTLDSIASQNQLNDIEVIIVNDGSPDHSIEIVHQHIVDIPHVRILEQENGGLSVARNNGMKKTNGDYIWFVDSDDYILPNSINYVLQIIENNPCVDVFASYLEVHDESNKKPVYSESRKNFTQGSGMDYLEAGCQHGAIQRFIFKKDFIMRNHLSFYPRILHEDDLFGFKMLYFAKDVLLLPTPIYAYTVNRGGSIMSSISMKTPRSLMFIHKELKIFMNNYVLQEDKEKFQKYIYNEINSFFVFCIDILDTKEYVEYYKECKPYIRKESLFLLRNPSTFFYGLRMFFFPRIPLLAYRFTKRVYHGFKNNIK